MLSLKYKRCLFVLFYFCYCTSAALAAPSCESLVEQLNTRYYTELKCNDGAPSYICSGIVLHTLEIDDYNDQQSSINKTSANICTYESTEPWCPNASSIKRDVVSFSFIQHEVTATYGYPIFPNAAGTLGYIFYPDSVNKYYLCSYPIDGMTFARKDCGCGPWGPPQCKKTDGDLSTCAKQDIYDAQDFYNRYINGKHDWDLTAMCSFGSSREQFDALIQTAQLIANEPQPAFNWNTLCNKTTTDKCSMINELVLKGWFGLPFNQVPIEAFFYVADDNNLYPNSDTAKRAALKYAKQFPNDVPVVGINIQKIYDGSVDNGPFFCDHDPK